METILETKSIPAILILIAVFMCANFIKGVLELVLKIRAQKDSASEASIKELTQAVNNNSVVTAHLDRRLGDVEKTYSELPKLKVDMRKFYSAIKVLSGERWSKIRKEIEEDTDI